MNRPNDSVLGMNPAGASSAESAAPLRGLAIASGVLVVLFAWPLYELVRHSLRYDLHSHIVLVPIVSAYLVWTARKTIPIVPAVDRRIGLAVASAGLLPLMVCGLLALSQAKVARDDWLALSTLAFLLGFWGICGWYLGRRTLRAVAFPLAFLLFMIPLPTAATNALQTLLQHGSADVAYAMLLAAGTPVFRQELVFQLPGIILEVAPECSGIRSSLALFITSIVAGHLFLRSPWRRLALAALVLPLALLRNGLRVFTIGELCVHVSPDMIDSFIHHQGGPIFFALSLVPFSVVLLWFVRAERRAGIRHPAAP